MTTCGYLPVKIILTPPLQNIATIKQRAFKLTILSKGPETELLMLSEMKSGVTF